MAIGSRATHGNKATYQRGCSARVGKPARRVQLKTHAAVRDVPLLPQLAALKQHKLASSHSGDRDYVFSSFLNGCSA
jgi:hypothetical protein